MIGLIDSGVGGANVLPTNSFIQYRSANFISYGSLSEGCLISFLDTHIKYLQSKKVDNIYVGCYTLSCLIKKLKLDLPVTTMLDLIDLSSFDTVIATDYTCDYFKSTHQVIRCPKLATQVELGLPIELPKYYTKTTGRLLLGCTHYYTIAQLIQEYYKPIKLVMPRFKV